MLGRVHGGWRVVVVAFVAAWLRAGVAWGQPQGVPRPGRLTRASVPVLAGGDVVARGVVLAGDGRMLTALGPVENARDLRVRYPDGRVDRALVVAVDSAWGVALVEGTAGHWPEGLSLAAQEARSGAAVSWLAAGRVVHGALRRRRSYVGGHAVLLRDAWELDPAPAASAVGSAVVDAAGAVVSLVVPPGEHAGAGAAPGPFGVPLAVLQALYVRAGVASQPWLGLVARDVQAGEESATSAGVRVTQVQADSPAERAGLRAGEGGDVIVGVDEREVRSLGDLGAALAGRRPGEVVTLHLMRGGARVDVPLLLEAHRSGVTGNAPPTPAP